MVSGKRVCDVIGAGILLVGAAPVLAAVAIALLAGGVRPVLWRSSRLGRDGRPFPLLMFRTMQGDGSRTTPRLTPVGGIVRAVSLDHLPMLINVIRGHLSLVGPRPTEPERVDLADPRWRQVLTVRPGLVSYAILSLGPRSNAAAAATRLNLEVAYVERAGALFDARLLGRAAVRYLASRGNVKAR